MKTARWWHQEGERWGCDLCPRGCRLRPGQAGFCALRVATEKGIVLPSWGVVAGLAIDPIEKKPLYHFYPGSQVLSFGTIGCNLGCRFCQNWHLSRGRPGKEPVGERFTPEAVAEMAVADSCRSVAFTYNEPLIFAEYAIECARACRQRGVKSVAVTAGYVSGAARQEFFAAMDAANIDLKGFSEAFYRRYCAAELRPVLETLRHVAHETEVWLEITTLLIPGANDAPEQIRAMATWIRAELGAEIPWHLTAYRPSHRLRRRPTRQAELEQARRVALECGVRFVYTGNLRDAGDALNTRCPACGRVLIVRRGFWAEPVGVASGAQCAGCGEELPGCFGETGATGGRR
jgi:pyruvate formate lyase activating enzyme